MNKTSEGIIQRFRERFIIPKSHWPKWSDLYKDYRPDIWGKYRDGKDIEQFLLEAVEEARREGQIDVLHRQCGVMGKYNCIVGCEFDKKYFDLVMKEISKLEGGSE